MLNFKLNILSSLILIFSLSLLSATYPSYPVSTKASKHAAEVMPWVQITNPTGGVLQMINTPMSISATADNTAGNLASIVIRVNGQAIDFGTTSTLTTTYMPTTLGQYTIEAIAGYMDDTQVSTQVTFNAVNRICTPQLIIPVKGVPLP